MIKLFRYELRRLLLNKLFLGILLASLGYGWLTLTNTIILGVAHTAPFSPWSFGYFLSQILPLICVGELFFLSFFTSKEELQIRSVIRATSMDQRRYAVIRCGAVLTGTLLLSLCVVALATVFYVRLFGWTNFGELLLPAMLTLLPTIIFCLGTGLLLVNLHPALIYVLMAAILLLHLLPLPMAISFSLSSFFSQYPLTMDKLDPAFHIPSWLIASKSVLTLLGLALAITAVNMQKTSFSPNHYRNRTSCKS